MKSRIDKLLEVLEKLEELLTAHGERQWSQWIGKARQKIINSDYAGVEYLLSA